MKKNIFIIVMIVGASLLLGALAGLFGLFEQHHDALCAISYHTCIYLVTGFFLFLVLLIQGTALFGRVFAIPTGITLALFKPPQLQA